MWMPDVIDPPEIAVDFETGRVHVADRGENLTYELRMGSGRGRVGRCAWIERFVGSNGELVETGVTTAEVMAVLRDVGREEDAARMALATAAFFERAECWEGRQIADRLRAEVEDGRNLRRVSLRPVQALIVERLVAGDSLADMCGRGGFLRKDGKPDTSWLQRRAGLLPARCSRTGKRRIARTASYPVFCRLARAVGAEPHQLGV